MAIVELARQTDLDRFVALKQLKVLDDDDPSYAQRFLRESRLAGALSHPNIVTVYDYFEHEGIPYIAMEYLQGGSLRPYIGHLTLPQAVGVLEAVLAGLTHAESNGIVHRDLKPENLMVTAEGLVKIADFGIAKATSVVETGAFKTRTGTALGTPAYMAPEQAMAQDVGPWTDLYSLGCIAFEMFTGRVPFDDSSEAYALLLRQISEQVPPVSSIVEGFEPALSDWTETLLEKDPAQRPQSAGSASYELEEIVLDVLGPRWRRDARLLEKPDDPEAARPLTPPPFDESSSRAPPASSAFESFSWGPEVTPVTPAPTPGPYTPPPRDLPGGPMVPPDHRDTPEPAGYETYDEPPPPQPPDRTDDLDPFTGRLAPALPEQPSPPPVVPDTPRTEPLRRPPPTGRLRTPAAKRRRWKIAVAAAAACAMLGGVAYVVAPERTTTGGLEQSLEGRNMTFDVPAGWTRGDRMEVSGLDLRDQVSAGATSRRGVAAGYTETTHPSLLPPAFLDTLAPAPEPTTVKVPAGVGYRYAGVRPGGSGPPLTVVTVPTGEGVATLACSAPAGTCDAISQTLELPGQRVFSPAPREEYAEALNGTMSRLYATEAEVDRRLNATRRPRVVSREASRLARAYDAAARAIGDIETAPFEKGPTRAIREQIATAQRAYTRVARAAADRDRGAYRTARQRANVARDRFEPRLEALRALGYDVGEDAG